MGLVSPQGTAKFVNTPYGPSRIRVYAIKNLDDRIKVLRERVEKGSIDPLVYTFTRQAINKKCGNDWCVPEKDNLGEAKAIFDQIRKNVRYTSDILYKDTYQHPAKTLKLRSADCDDYSTLVCASLATVGIPCRFKVIRTKGAREWNHIYAQAGFPRANPTKWVTLDASVPVRFGWEAPPSMVADARVFPLR